MLYLTNVFSVDLAHCEVSRVKDWVSGNCGTSIFNGCMVWIDKSVPKVTDRHHEACRVMPNSDPE